MSETKLEKPVVLYVDDERNNLLAFKASFRMEFEVLLAISPDEAMEILKTNTPQVIISDYRMPFMTGIEMFEKIRQKYPEPFRVLLTGYGDLQALADAINKGQVFRYIKKPWIEDEIRNVVRDASEYFQTKVLLAERNKELAEAYKELDRFVYSVSHDLRAPLMGILAIAGFLRKSQNIEEVNEYGELVIKNVNRLDEFIANLLEYYKVKRGELIITSLSFEDIFKEMFEIYESEMLDKNIHFEMDVKQHEDFRGDKLILLVALQNFFSNSIKYQRLENNNKTIKLSAHVLRGEAVVVIEDNGIGIDKEFQNRVFEMFFRASSQAVGSGIGLYNAKLALNKLGAEVKVESEAGVGTRFTIKIPSK
jgi:signal transduction histidine kinase